MNGRAANRWTRALLFGALVSLVGATLLVLPWGAELEEHFGLAWLFQLRGPVKAPDDVVIVAIDKEAAVRLGLPLKPSEWPRSLHARLVRNLARAGARVIAFDLTFDTPSKDASNDHAFAEAIRDAGNVVLVEALNTDITRDGARNLWIHRLVPPIPELEAAAAALGPFPLPKAERVNGYWAFKAGGESDAALPVQAWQVFLAHEAIQSSNVRDGHAPRAEPPHGAPRASNDGRLSSRSSPDRRSCDVSTGVLRGPTAKESWDRSAVGSGRARAAESLAQLCSEAGEMRYLDFVGPARSIETISYDRVLNMYSEGAPTDAAAAAPRQFRGKAVFVGFSAATQPEQDRIRDDYRTVFSRENGLDISGVEIAATAFADLSHDRAIRSQDSRLQIAEVALWGMLCGVLCLIARPAAAAAVLVVLVMGYAFIALHVFEYAATWLPLVFPGAVQGPLALFGGVWLNYRRERRERSSMRRVFRQFLPNETIDRLAANEGSLARERQLIHGVCLATDAEKYTTLSERMDPLSLGELMNRYYAELFGPVHRHGGVVSDIVGDAMFAYWSAPTDSPHIRGAACAAALEIAAAVDAFNERAESGCALPTRIGLHAGEIMVGAIGADERYEYRAVGDIVNASTRIEGLNKDLGTRLLVAGTMTEGVEGFLFRGLGRFHLRGRSGAVEVAELVNFAAKSTVAERRLCEEFHAALTYYESGRWDLARHAFCRLLESHPNDGPSSYYKRQCEARLAETCET